MARLARRFGKPDTPNQSEQSERLLLELVKVRKEDRVLDRRRDLESSATEGDSPVFQIQTEFKMYPSSAEHEEFRVNLPGPPGKAKYDLSPIVHPVP